jgi:hypothetical protein
MPRVRSSCASMLSKKQVHGQVQCERHANDQGKGRALSKGRGQCERKTKRQKCRLDVERRGRCSTLMHTGEEGTCEQ